MKLERKPVILTDETEKAEMEAIKKVLEGKKKGKKAKKSK